jgi:hypothetical protein
MEHENVEREVARLSAQIYLPISIGAALLFLLLTTLSGDYEPVARIGGTVWILLLSLIVSMPIVISAVKKRFQNWKF